MNPGGEGRGGGGGNFQIPDGDIKRAPARTDTIRGGEGGKSIK